GFVPLSPLVAGFLTGKIDDNTKFDPTDFRNNTPRFLPQARKANVVLVDLIKAVAMRAGTRGWAGNDQAAEASQVQAAHEESLPGPCLIYHGVAPIFVPPH